MVDTTENVPSPIYKWEKYELNIQTNLYFVANVDMMFLEQQFLSSNLPVVYCYNHSNYEDFVDNVCNVSYVICHLVLLNVT